MNLQKTQPVGKKVLIMMLRGSWSTDECSCDIDVDMTWVQITIYKFAVRGTFGSVSFGGTKLILGVIALAFPMSFRVWSNSGDAQAVPWEVRLKV